MKESSTSTICGRRRWSSHHRLEKIEVRAFPRDLKERLRDQLMTLWMQLLDLDARVTRGSPVDPELTGTVRALSHNLAHAGEALTELERLLETI